MPLAVGTRLGPYEILSTLGAGGMGEVYRARDSRLGREVALKILHEALAGSAMALERFQREARAVAAVQHPNICAIYDIGETSDHLQFIVMELLDGETMQRRLMRGRVDLRELVDAGIALADALDFAHRAGIIHRDIKPANIFLTSHGPKLLDFGLAKSAPADAVSGGSRSPTLPPAAVLTDPGSTVCTVAYMSPEQVRGEPVDARTDLFSFGAVLYEMATGYPPFSGSTYGAISGAILYQVPLAPCRIRADLPMPLERSVLKALEKDRDVRCQTASELCADLKRLKREIGSNLLPQTVPGPRTAGGAPVPLVVDAPSHQPQTATVTSGAPPRVSPANPDSSSDAQMVAAVIGRHRWGLAVVAGALALVAAGGISLLRSRPSPATQPPFVSLQDLEVSQLTTSGNAQRPAISPDGNYVAYVQQDGTNFSLWIRQATTASNVRIVPSEPGVALMAPTVTPDGGFVDFVRVRSGSGGSFELWRVPFLGGSPKRLFDNVWSPVGWSPDGRRLAFVRTDLSTGSDALVIADAEGTGERVLAVRRRPRRFYSFSLTFRPMIRPAWSLDGRLIAVVGGGVQAGADTPELVYIDVATGTERAITLGIPDGSPVHGLAWIDAESLILNHATDPSSPPQLWRMSLPDGQLSRLTNDVNRYVGVSVTADRGSLVTARSETRIGIWVADASAKRATETVPSVPFQLSHASVAWATDRLVYVTGAAGRLAIMSLDADRGGTPEEIVSNADSLAVTSDGRTVVFNAVGPGGRAGIWKIDIDGRHPLQVASSANGSPVVTPDNRQVIFLSNRTGLQTPWIVSIDGGTPREVVKAFAGAEELDVSPDGKSLLVGTTQELVLVCDLPACMARRSLMIHRFPGGGLRWTPDGRSIAYVDSSNNIWVQPLDGIAHQLTRFTDGRRVVGFGWSRDGKRLAISRAAITNDIVLFKGLRKAGTR
jgi:serine/threonine protein kinase